jgi:dihydropteroate synthase
MIKKVNEKNILKEVQGIGFDAAYLECGVKKHKFLSLKIFDLKPQQSSIIKQTALSCGCDCAVNRGVLDCSIEKSDCILSGNLVQLENVVQKLKKQQFSLSKTANEIENAVKSSLNIQKPK